MAAAAADSFVYLLLVILVVSPRTVVLGSNSLRPDKEMQKYQQIRARLAKLNKPSVLTFMSPDGDTIDCVPTHLQPAFDHPKLKGHKPLDPPEQRPRVGEQSGVGDVDGDDDVGFPQAWRGANQSSTCPDGTVPIRRTTEADLLRASSVEAFARKPVRRDSTSGGHEHAIGYVKGGQLYGAKATLSVWPARVAAPSEFSLSQIWIISGSFAGDLNTIEAGWQVSPELYGDDSPRFFTYWTSDAYQETGCYNLHCAGFVQTNSKVAIGAAISPTSTYSGKQFDITVLIWKDPTYGHWWLQLGSSPSGAAVGYWPAELFSHLGGRADMVQFGGEVVNTRPRGAHTATQMGSGRFAGEGYDRAAYFRGVQVVDWDNSLIPAAGVRLLADHPGCYDIQGGYNRAWGYYFYYGGPGKNARCP